VRELVRKGVPVKCCVIGDGPERPGLENLCKDLRLESNVTFLGFLDRPEDVYALMKSSKVLVFPSTREGFGLVVVEANACGLPAVVVKARHNAASSLVKHGESGFVCNLDVQEIADAVYRLLIDDATYARMQQAAMAWARQLIGM